MIKTVSKVLSHIFALILVLGLFSPGVPVNAAKSYPDYGGFTCDTIAYCSGKIFKENIPNPDRWLYYGSKRRYIAAIVLYPWDISIYEGRIMTSISFDYVKSDEYSFDTYTIKIWESEGYDTNFDPGTLVYSQKIENEPKDGWNEYILDQPYHIHSTGMLTIGIETGKNGGAVGINSTDGSNPSYSMMERYFWGDLYFPDNDYLDSAYRWRQAMPGGNFGWNIKCTLAHEHDLTYVPKVEPGYKTKSGKEAFYICKPCGKKFEDAEMTREISDIVTWGVIPPKQDAAEVFKDVRPDHYFYNPVLWAVENEITAGTSDTTFSPYQFCTRAQIVTFLWRYAGKPDGQYEEFIDVTSRKLYYYKAVYWAAEQGITEGIGLHRFAPNSDCTRAEAVSFLYRMMGKPEVSITETKFEDISSEEYYYDAVLWAVENGITAGTSETTFSPYYRCTRAQIVSFIYRMNDAFGK